MSAALFVAHARRWIGTPYVHQASEMNAGCDCLGLLRGVWRDVYGHSPEVPPAYAPTWSEVSGDEVLWTALLRHFEPSETGVVLLFRMHSNAAAKHVGILSAWGENSTFIHSYQHHGVVESPLSTPWRRRVVARFDVPVFGEL